MSGRPPSLKRPLIIQPLIVQGVVLFASFMVLVALLIRADSGGHYTEQTLSTVVAEAVVRRRDGSLVVRSTPELRALQAANPSTWFVAEDAQGRSVSFGEVPLPYRPLTGTLRGIAWADLRDIQPPFRMAAVIREERGPAGRLTIMAMASF